tara:strand:- start:1235 stop:1870 length:636 start_codon:yes stop_codon:yes gene_type:complete
MVTNSYINTTTYTQEQDLIGNLVVESIQMHGQDFIYIPRNLVNVDTVFNEDTLSSFTTTHTIEMQIDSVDGFEGEGEMLSQFGLSVNDQIITTLSKSRFLAETGSERPKVGDLIYLPLVDKAFQIKFVEDEIPFYQLGKMHVFQLTSELFIYSHETINTGVSEIDDNFTNDAIADDTVDNAVADDGLVPLSTTVTDSVIDFTQNNPFSEDY